MKPVPRVSEAEWEVLSLLWKDAPLSSPQIIARLAARSWKPSTVRTFLTRLEKKGALRVEESPEGKLYTPAISREECVRKESQSFLDRVFEGATASLLVHFAKSKPLSAQEMAELEEILAKNKQRKS